MSCEQKKPYAPPAMTPIGDLISQVYPTKAVQPAAVGGVPAGEAGVPTHTKVCADGPGLVTNSESVATSAEAPGLPTPSAERAAELLPRGTPQPAPPQPVPPAPAEPKPMRLAIDHNPFEFLGYGRPDLKSTCRVRVWVAERREGETVPEFVVLVSELPDNPGIGITDVIVQRIGITDVIVQIASLVLPELMPSAEYRAQVRWVEHRTVEGQHTFDVVTFGGYDAHGPIYARNRWGTMFSGPYWHRITQHEFMRWIGAEVEL